MSWSKRSKTDNSKSDAMGLGNDNEVEVRSREQGLDWVVNAAVSLASSPSRLGRSGLVMCKWDGRLGVENTLGLLEFSSTDDVGSELVVVVVVVVVVGQAGSGPGPV